jgi:nucleoside 2-deoxyribosyltransferase
MKESKENRSSIINAVSTPIKLAALIVLVIEAPLIYLLTKVPAQNIVLIIFLMIGILVFTLWGVYKIERAQIALKNAEIIPPTGIAETSKDAYAWDVFLAAPMASLSSDTYKQTTDKIKEIKRALEIECGFQQVFFAGSNLDSQGEFHAADVSIEMDINAMKKSRIFILLYPEKIVSSVLFEAGIALALGKPSFYFSAMENLPFLMQQANQRFDFVKIHPADSFEKILTIIKNNKKRIFEA